MWQNWPGGVLFRHPPPCSKVCTDRVSTPISVVTATPVIGVINNPRMARLRNTCFTSIPFRFGQNRLKANGHNLEDSVNRLGNHVILSCGEAEIVLAHMRQGSVTVVPGDGVSTGERLGEVGNSGASTEPQLHIHAQRPPGPGAPPLSGEPLALRIDGRFLQRGDCLSGPDG